MVQGPNEARFRTSLSGASWESVDDGAAEWLRCADLLDVVSRSLETAAGKDQKIGGQTGPAMGAAFRRTSTSVADRARLLLEGKAALDSAARVIDKAEKAQKAMDRMHPVTDDPGSWTRPVGPLTKEDLEAQSRHQQKVNEFQENYAARERISRQWTENIDNVFADSTEVMKKIHGEPDPIPPPPPDDKTGPGAVTTPGSPQGPRDTTDDPRDPTGDPRDPDDHNDDPRDPDDHNDPRDPDDHGGDNETDTPPTHTDHPSNPGGTGIGTGTLGGLAAAGAGGAIAFGGFRGGLQLPSALSSTGVRPIGSTGRIGTSGALGRTGGAIAPGSPVSRTGASGAAGRGAAGRGVAGTGSPVGRGGRGAGGAKGTGRGGRVGAGIGAGRGAGKKDEDKKQAPRDLFDDGEDWIDDEGAAPDVLS